jgi:HEAT repeat protein
MAILHRLAGSLGRRDEVPNQELAKELSEKGSAKEIAELVELLHHKKKFIQSDCIKVLYEIGERNPALISAYVKEFVPLLNHKDNRMIWGTMTALNAIAAAKPEAVYPYLAKIMAAVDKGSVITRDQAVGTLIRFCSVPEYYETSITLLLEQLKSCPPNQLPMYAENMQPVINSKNKQEFIKILASRLDDLEKESKKKRVEKVIAKPNRI